MERAYVMREKTTVADREAQEGYAGFTIFLFFGIALALSLALVFSETGGFPRGFYERCLDQMIGQCDRNASSYASVADVRASYDEARRRVRFYVDERDRLIAIMEEQALGKDPQRVEYYLRKAYSDSSKAGL